MKTKPITKAFISGAICGALWWPTGSLAGKNLSMSARGPWGFIQKGDSFRDALNSLLMKDGGDFQNAQFTADTVIRVEMRFSVAPYRWITRVREMTIASLPGCADLVNPEANSCDFGGKF